MNISKNSWHYKLNCFWDRNYIHMDMTSLCSYFWNTIINILRSVGVILGFSTAFITLITLFIIYPIFKIT